MKAFFRLLVWITGFMFLIALLSLLSFPAFTIAVIAIWYFSKKDPNKRNRNIAVVVAVLSFFGMLLSVGGGEEPEVAVEPKTEEVEVVEETEAEEMEQEPEETEQEPEEIEEVVEEEPEPEEEEIEEKDVTTLDTLIEETHIEDYIVDEETGITLVSAPVTDVLGGRIGVEGFNQEMWNTLKDYNELFPDGVMYLGYGDINGEDYNKIRTYFSRETLDNIDFSKVIVEGESIVYADRYNVTGFGEIELNYNSSNSDTYSVEDGNPLDNLWMFSTVKKIERGNK